MDVNRNQHVGRHGTVFGFHIMDGKNRLWSGTDFSYAEHRDDAIKVAMRELTGQPPIINDAAIQAGTAAILRAMSKARFGQLA